MSHSDVRSATVTSTGTVTSGAVRLKQIIITNDATTAGTCVLRDGGASGTVLLTVSTNIGETLPAEIGGAGIRFITDIHATMTNLTRVTVFVG